MPADGTGTLAQMTDEQRREWMRQQALAVSWMNEQQIGQWERSSEAELVAQYLAPVLHHIPLYPLTSEQIAEHQRAEAILLFAQVKRQRAEMALAEEKANALLRELIGQKEWEVYDRTGRIWAYGRKAEYLIYKSKGIEQFIGREVATFCVAVVNKFLLPPTDNVLALKLFVEADEERFLAAARRTRTGQYPCGRKAFDPEAACARPKRKWWFWRGGD